MRVVIAITLSAMALVLSYQLLIPPVAGLADQGDFARICGVFQLGPKASIADRYYASVTRSYIRDSEFKTPGWEMATSELVPVGTAIFPGRLISRDGSVDITVVGLVHILVFLFAAGLILVAAMPRLSVAGRAILCVALVFIFCDGGYALYFNSFYTESAVIVFLFLLFGAWLWIARDGRADVAHLTAFAASGVLWIFAKPQVAPLGFILGLYSLRFARLTNRRRARWGAVAVSAVLVLASVAQFRLTPAAMRQAAVYNLVFRQMLPNSPQPEEDLRDLGLDPGWKTYGGTGAFTVDSGLHVPGFGEELLRRCDNARIAWFYVRRPQRLWLLTAGALPYSSWLRPPYGNFEKQYAPMTQSTKWRMWTEFKQHWVSPLASLVLAFLGVSGAITLFRALLRRTLWGEMYGMLALLGVVAFFVVILGDADDIVRHMLMYNLIADVCVVFAVIAGCEVAGSLSK
jgi:hypothetical protein